MAVHGMSAYLESRILCADRMELVQILYQAALESVEDARGFLEQGNIVGRAKAINRAVNILGELIGSLNHEAGGDLSRQLLALYDYMMRLVIDANRQQADAPLAEASSLLRTLQEGWLNCKVAPSLPATDFVPAPAAPAPAPVDSLEVEYSRPGTPAPACRPYKPQEAACEPYRSTYASRAYGSAPYQDVADEQASEERLALSY